MNEQSLIFSLYKRGDGIYLDYSYLGSTILGTTDSIPIECVMVGSCHLLLDVVECPCLYL